MHIKPGLFCSWTSTETNDAAFMAHTAPGLSASFWGRHAMCEMTKGCPGKSLKMIVLPDRYYKMMLKREGIPTLSLKRKAFFCCSHWPFMKMILLCFMQLLNVYPALWKHKLLHKGIGDYKYGGSRFCKWLADNIIYDNMGIHTFWNIN